MLRWCTGIFSAVRAAQLTPSRAFATLMLHMAGYPWQHMHSPALPPQLIKGNTFGGTAFASYGAFWMGCEWRAEVHTQSCT